jgi:hypothetical protein
MLVNLVLRMPHTMEEQIVEAAEAAHITQIHTEVVPAVQAL